MKKQDQPESTKINEVNYSMIIRILREVVPTVKTIGFVTAENPMIEEIVKKYEKDAKTKFKDHLKDSHYGHTKVMGKYDTLENPYFIPNIRNKTNYLNNYKFRLNIFARQSLFWNTIIYIYSFYVSRCL